MKFVMQRRNFCLNLFENATAMWHSKSCNFFLNDVKNHSGNFKSIRVAEQFQLYNDYYSPNGQAQVQVPDEQKKCPNSTSKSVWLEITPCP